MKCPRRDCFVYLCPTSKEDECAACGGFDTCCDNKSCPGVVYKSDNLLDYELNQAGHDPALEGED